MALPGRFRTSSFCLGGECVAVSVTREGVEVAVSSDPDRALHFSAPEWEAFLAGVRAGEFDPEHQPSLGDACERGE